jgi:hypothetical protein
MIHDDKAHLPACDQEIDVSLPLQQFSAQAALGLIVAPNTQNLECGLTRIIRLLEIAQREIPRDYTDVVYRAWMAYAAGYRGSRCLTCGITRLDYWYQVGRADAREEKRETTCLPG